MTTAREFRLAFVTRLTHACDQSSKVPPAFQGRQQMIAVRMGVAPEAVSKWFKAVSMPRPSKLLELAELLEVDAAWLSLGVKVELDRAERKIHAHDSSGAVMLVRGLVTLAGGTCGDPAPTDPRAGYVDFYATLRGQVWPIRVALAREVEPDRFEVMLPREFKDVRTFAVIPLAGEKYQFLDMAAPAIDLVKMLKTGEYAVAIDRAEGGKYTTDSLTWQRVRLFGELV